MVNVRVYGLMVDPDYRVLVSDEYIRGDYITKFPGGGLEFGEGTRDCLKREFNEEMDLEVSVDDHVYTTDFFQMSAFNAAHQILSIYYYVTPLAPILVPIRDEPFQFDERQMDVYNRTGETETFRFIEWEQFGPAVLTLPIDKVVAELVKKSLRLTQTIPTTPKV